VAKRSGRARSAAESEDVTSAIGVRTRAEPLDDPAVAVGQAAHTSADITEHELKRRAILEGAAEVFARRGFVAGTTKEIAAEVGLSQPAIYHYVGSKTDLLREITLQVDRDMFAALQAGMARSSRPSEQLRGVIEEYTAAVVRDRRVFTVFWQEGHALPQDIRDRIRQDQREFINQVGKIIARLQRAKVLPAGPVSIMARAVLSMPSWMHQWYLPEGQMTAAEIADVYCRLIGLE
jgi:TetR/AcrR family transcriptional regulator, cholesterol catabolism regulator